MIHLDATPSIPTGQIFVPSQISIYATEFMECVRIVHEQARRIEHLELNLHQDAEAEWYRMLRLNNRDKRSEKLGLDFFCLKNLDIRVANRKGNLETEREIASQFYLHSEGISGLTLGTYSDQPSKIILGRAVLLPAPVKNLTVLKLRNVDITKPKEFLSDMSGLHNLTSLWLLGTRLARMDYYDDTYCDEISMDPSRSEPRTSLPSIQDLHVLGGTLDDVQSMNIGFWDVNCVAFFRHVSLPNLHLLEIDEKTIYMYYRVPLKEIRWEYFISKMISDSGCTIRYLTIIPEAKISVQIWRFLQSNACASIEELTLRHRRWTEADTLQLLDGLHRNFRLRVLDDREPNFTTPWFSSTLKRLTLYGCYAEDSEHLIRLANSRMLDASLEYLHVEVVGLDKNKHAGVIQAFKKIRALGKEAYLESTPNSFIQTICRNTNANSEGKYEGLGTLEIYELQ